MFFTPTEPTAEDVRSGKARQFKGDGTHILRVPGIVGDPESVRVGTTDLPARVPATFLNNHLNGQTVSTDMPLYKMSADAEGTPVLLRSQFSNDGIWQKDLTITVWGAWEDDPRADGQTDAPKAGVAPARPKNARPTPEQIRAELAGLPVADLVTIALKLGVPGAETTPQPALIEAVLAAQAKG